MDPTAPVIVEVALNGQTPKSVNPHVPRSSEELVADALACIDAGAAIVHTHIDRIAVSAEEAAESYAEHFAPVLERHPDALLYPTVGFASTIEGRMAHIPLLVERAGLRIGLIDPGSVNLGGLSEDGLPAPIDFAYTNTPAAIRYKVEQCEALRLGPSIALFEPGFLRHALAYWRAGRLPQGALLKFYLGGEYGYMGASRAGLGFGLPPTPFGLDVYIEMLGDCPLPWSAAVIGGDVFENGVARHALERGGHLHVGLEDHAGPTTPTNVELVRRAVALAREVGRPVANASEAAKLLALPR